MKRAVMALSALLLSAVILYAIVLEAPSGDDPPIVERIRERAVEDTGATNLVSAIYLGYRAYDTLGETVVLLLAVSGIVYLVGAKR